MQPAPLTSMVSADGAALLPASLGNQQHFMQIQHTTQQQAPAQMPLHVLQQLLALNPAQSSTFIHQSQMMHSDHIYQASMMTPLQLQQLGVNIGQQHAPFMDTTGELIGLALAMAPAVFAGDSEEDDSNGATRAKHPRTSVGQDHEFDDDLDEATRGGGGSEALEQNRAKNREAQRRVRAFNMVPTPLDLSLTPNFPSSISVQGATEVRHWSAEG